VACGRLTKVVISAPGRRRGPVEVKRLDITASGVRVNLGCTASTAARLRGTALVGFAGLAGMAGTSAFTVVADADRVKITLGLGPVNATTIARVTRAGPGGIRIAVISAGGARLAG
jgi:hypothetical protein